MATQSLIMGDAFGRSFQYGKRKISAMTNEEFNALTTEKIAETIYSEYKNIIPKLNQSLVDSQQLQNKVIDELLALPSNFLAQIFDKIANPDKIENTFIPNSNDPTDSRTWAPGYSPPASQDFNPPQGAPQPSPTPQPSPPTPGTQPGAQSPHTPTPTTEKQYTLKFRYHSGLTKAFTTETWTIAQWEAKIVKLKALAIQYKSSTSNHFLFQVGQIRNTMYNTYGIVMKP